MDHMLDLVIVFTLLFSGTTVLGASQCSLMLLDVEGDSGVTASIPPQIEGEWVSTSCEVRPGPEFVTRRYKFHTDSSFTAYQFYYTDNHCSSPAYSLKLRGSIQVEDESWLVRGGTKAEYQLDRVLVTSHRSDITEYLITKVNTTCPGFIPSHEHWLTNMRYHLYSWYEDKDCLEALSFSMHELQLIRVELHQIFEPRFRTFARREELFTGDIHTYRQFRRHYRPQSYQVPLVSIMQQENCSVCQLVHQSDDVNPPILPSLPEYPVILHGEWVSTRCEVNPQVYFLIRHLIFHGNHTWEGYYHHYSDPLCRNPTFSVYAKGYHSEGLKSEIVKGGTEFDFISTEVKVTPRDTATTNLLNILVEGDECGRSGTWKIGVEQDVTPTYGCTALGIRLPHTEYELMRMEYDLKHDAILLYNGQRPSDGSSPTSIDQRPTSYRTPLLQCGGVNFFSQDNSQDSIVNDLNNSATMVTLSLWQFVIIGIVHYL
ncbi:protein APCDD1-like isoform X2 [Glandiceps talaboti]